LIVADGSVAKSLTAAKVPFNWLHQVVPDLDVSVRSCASMETERPFYCCGGAAPLSTGAPEEARRMGMMALKNLAGHDVNDGRCARHFAHCGTPVRDAVARLLELAAQ